MSELKIRSQVAEEFTWNTPAIFPTDEVWQQKLDETIKQFSTIKQFEGKVTQNAQTLADCLKLKDQLSQDVSVLYLYAGIKFDQDTAEAKYQAMSDRMDSVAAEAEAAASFIKPEIIAYGQAGIDAFVAENKGLEVYKHYFHNLFREQAHILTADKEELLAKVSELTGGPSSIYDMLTDADMVFGKALDSEGKEHEVTSGRYRVLLQSPDRVLRQNAYKAFWAEYIKQKNTIAQALNYSIKGDKFEAEVRNYESSLAMGLSNYNIPKELYTNLIDTIDKNMHLFHRYLDIRKRCLGVEQLEFYDIYVPIVKDADTKMDWEEAKQTVHDGVAALGEEYQKMVQESYDNRWIDVYENKGKTSGAYSWGVYGAPHPFVLMNYDDSIGDMFVLAHELGHAMHSRYTCDNQPPIYGSYSIFLAEIASTVNETLVMEHLLGKTKDDADKTKYLYLLNEFLEGFRSTIFRQTMFAEFEMKAHEMAAKGEALNSTSLNALYKSLLEKHFGDHINIDDTIEFEWSFVPHFYRAFYVYQYATGYSCAIAFSKAIKEGGQPAVDKYLGLLKGGCHDYSLELLKQAGIDMTSPKPIQDAMDVFEDILNRFEKACFGE